MHVVNSFKFIQINDYHLVFRIVWMVWMLVLWNLSVFLISKNVVMLLLKLREIIVIIWSFILWKEPLINLLVVLRTPNTSSCLGIVTCVLYITLSICCLLASILFLVFFFLIIYMFILPKENNISFYVKKRIISNNKHLFITYLINLIYCCHC